MVTVVSGAGLGLFGSSVSVLGSGAAAGVEARLSCGASAGGDPDSREQAHRAASTMKMRRAGHMRTTQCAAEARQAHYVRGERVALLPK